MESKNETTKQNNRKLDEKRHPQTDTNATPEEKEWDPERHPDQDREQEKKERRKTND